MKKTAYLFVILFLLTLPQNIFSQEKKPKVVLVLSGGGAKGVAHIPLLQALDSLHIVPDLIIGTSMGSIVGGLYAMGYSGDSIHKITETIDWDKVLSGTLSLNNVSVEEKSEFQRYLVGVDLKKGKPTSLGSLVSDQNLREYLSELTYPVYNIKDFDHLSIPFRAMATDLVRGKKVILSEGSLALAMRSSMSLPGVFRPVPYKETLLVDGGVMDNFATDVAQDMKADIIIGSDVGGGMEPLDKLTNVIEILLQMSTLPSNIIDNENRERCTILVDHLPNLKYSTGDFAFSSEIYKEGKIATKQNMFALTALADKLKEFKQKPHLLPKTVNEFILDTIIYKDICKHNLALVIARTNIKTKTKYTTKELVKGINRAMGTNAFTQITYSHFNEGDKNGVILNGFEHTKSQVNASLHYDSYRGVGLILNYTGRNILGSSSRILTTIDIAEQPRFRIDYQKNFGKQKEWWWGSEVYGAFLNQEIFIDGKSANNMLYNAVEFNNQINRNINSLNSFVGFSLNYDYTELVPKYRTEYNNNKYNLRSYHFNDIELNAHYSFNNMDKVFFANKGTILLANFNRSLLTDVNASYIDNSKPSVNNKTNGYTKFGIDYEKRIPLAKRITGIIGANANFIFEDKLKSNEISFNAFGYGAKYFLGGLLPGPGGNSYAFPGLNDDELVVNQFMNINVDLQFNFSPKTYITPHFNLATVGFSNFNNYIKDAFYPTGNWTKNTEPSLLLSSGATASYVSILGPINFDVSWVNEIDKVRLFFSVGLLFNLAD